jgi:hypothetical protein
MSRFRRATTGTSFFFTVVAYRRRPILCDPLIRTVLRDVTGAWAWPYSTFERYLQAGVYAWDWDGGPELDSLDFE